MKIKKIGAEAILTSIFAPIIIGVLFWFVSFVVSTYQVMGEVNNQKSDILEIKQDVKDVKNFLIGRK
ncbi:MAG: hypothetical protein RLZ75_737 [Pseudomonadota bacterium]